MPTFLPRKNPLLCVLSRDNKSGEQECTVPGPAEPMALNDSSDWRGKSLGGLFCSRLAVLEMRSMALELADGRRVAIS